ncbi:MULTISPECIES: DUF262 domain-containing protein [Limnospira]|uniref:DUF262 domain-containing protein n=1 Tax=Limnospira TaxID=2596745 RepID=UPI0002803D6C|nr:DUF262 domain-containing protein [Limnospira indica]EKD06713.1 hypothetical protein SPLC1_S533070 [Arthrospira platensis C1]QJB26601.1 DUF262 domain-containing protein [Limnospira fusiformis SAG 85.79]QNH59933.1 MAG: DUF262 domain-containing protein [Limnospira indica BM01]UWU48726.1 Protein of unknown function DUF262 [Arthrospira platensis C1]
MTENNNLNTDFDDEIDIDDEVESNDEGLNEPFDPTKIRVDTRKITIDLVLKRIEYKELDLAPDFQRQAIWTNDAKSRLIESILIRIPLPAFYIDATDDDKWLVIDGLQRLTALKQFIFDQTLVLTGLQYLSELEHKKYDELPRKYQRRILETELTLSTIEPGTPPAVKYNIFRRINTGGVPLSPQEIRHALNQGKVTEMLRRLAKSHEFLKATKFSQSKKQKRMSDREFILGFMAHKIYGYTKYKNFESRDNFLVATMTIINQKISDDKLEQIEHDFTKAMIAAYDIFGDDAFRKLSNNTSRRYPVNQALFEAWSVNLSQLKDSEIETLKHKKDDVINRFKNLVDSDDEFLESISQVTNKVDIRFSRIENLIQEVLT